MYSECFQFFFLGRILLLRVFCGHRWLVLQGENIMVTPL